MPPKKNLKLSAVRLRRLSEFSRGEFLAAAGGEMRSNYFKNRAPRLEIRLPLTKSRSCFGTKWELRPRAPFGFASARGGQAGRAKRKGVGGRNFCPLSLSRRYWISYFASRNAPLVLYYFWFSV